VPGDQRDGQSAAFHDLDAARDAILQTEVREETRPWKAGARDEFCYLPRQREGRLPQMFARIKELSKRGENEMSILRKPTPERLSAFSDGVFAVLITVLVLELRPPELPTFAALLSLWHTWLSYAVSYLFIAIVWVNHHYLMRFADEATPRLLWFNFAHLFSMSLLPLATAWMAVSKLAPEPVSFYAAVFFLVNATYIALIRELVDRAPDREVPPRVRRIMRIRSLTTLCFFGAAAVVALAYPLAGLAICIACLIFYLRPDPPLLGNQSSTR
jgi:uncharacterized membrane protein